jgi:hypothetical protein
MLFMPLPAWQQPSNEFTNVQTSLAGLYRVLKSSLTQDDSYQQ